MSVHFALISGDFGAALDGSFGVKRGLARAMRLPFCVALPWSVPHFGEAFGYAIGAKSLVKPSQERRRKPREGHMTGACSGFSRGDIISIYSVYYCIIYFNDILSNANQ